jgi:6-pyruvoyltetrahydropterin/6-carboxytetrahydropterin synthase
VIELDAAAPKLDKVGRVIDFSVLKDRIGGFIERDWDHAFLVFDQDRVLIDFLASNDFKHAVLPVNPTAENLAYLLLYGICPRELADTGVRVRRVVVMETENCWASDELSD